MAPPRARWSWRLIPANAAVWGLMVIILVIVPDWLEQWMSLEIARFVAWAFACAIWVVAVERYWQERFGPFARFFLHLMLWVGAALVAI